MANRFSIRRKRLAIGAGCVFCLACLIAVSQAAMMASVLTVSGDTIAGGSSAQWTISNDNLFGIPPLNCSQEIASVSSVDSILLTGGGTYQAGIGIQNGDLIITHSERKVSAGGPSVFKESLLFEGAGQGAPEGGCGNTADLVGAVENVTPAVDPYCSLVMVGTGLMGSGLEYQSEGFIGVGSPEAPDAFAFDFSGSGHGLGQVGIDSVSMTGAGGPGTLGYQNAVSQHVTTFGKPFTMSGSVRWTSFAKTFDSPTVEG